VSSLDQVGGAVVRIETTGSFVEPYFTSPIPSGGYSASGFVFDPSGLVLTNNHVIAGAALVHVYVDNETSPRLATVLGKSECSDVAVISLPGDGYQYLEIDADGPSTGQRIYAAGYPVGTSDLTLTGGIVSKSRVTNGGATSWASLDYEIEHDARLNPGNSGGPLLSEGVSVVGINYADSSETDQSYAISMQEVLPILDRMSSGEDIDSLGINGEAFYEPLINDTGIWVISVESGSVADQAGVRAGDLIYELEGIGLAVDGTMADYCDLLKSHSADDVLSIEVFRASTHKFLEGRLNGDGLTEFLSLIDAVNVVWNRDRLTYAESSIYLDTSSIWSDDLYLTVDVPNSWTDTTGDPSSLGPLLVAAPSIDNFYGTSWTGQKYWWAPGIQFGATTQWNDLNWPEIMAKINPDVGSLCSSSDLWTYTDAFYYGNWQWFTCEGSAGAIVISMAVGPIGNESAFTAYLTIQLSSIADLPLLAAVTDTFWVDENFD